MNVGDKRKFLGKEKQYMRKLGIGRQDRNGRDKRDRKRRRKSQMMGKIKKQEKKREFIIKKKYFKYFRKEEKGD